MSKLETNGTPVLSTADRDLLRQPEGPMLERKAKADITAIARVVCAFLNTNGGRVLVGVEEDGRIIGVPNPKATLEKLRATLFGQLSPTASFLISMMQTEQDKTVLLLEVTPGADGPYAFKGSIYTRDGERDRQAKAEEVRAMVRKLDEVPRWEAQTTMQLAIADLDAQELTRTSREIFERRFTQLPEEPEALLKALYLVRGGQLTNAAVVLFAEEPAKLLPQTRIRAVAYASDEHENLLDNQLFEGHIFSLYGQLQGFLQKHLAIKAQLEDEPNGARTEQPAYPAAALREALWNALMHRDYSSLEGGIKLTLYPQRLELWNSGRLPDGVTVSELRAGGLSHPRNPDLAHVLMLRGRIERLGIGGRRIVEACRAAGLPMPKWEERGGGTQLTFYLRKEVTGQAASNQLLDRITTYLRDLEPGQRFTAREYQQAAAADFSERQGRLDLGQMIKVGVVERRGNGQHTYYVRTELPV